MQAAQEEAAALRGELAGVKSDRVDLQRRVGELRGALKTSVDHTKVLTVVIEMLYCCCIITLYM